MDFPGNKRTLGLRPPAPKLKRFREHPHPPQGEGSGRDPGSLKSTLVLPPATSLCPPRTMPQPQVYLGPSQGQHLGASLALGWDQVDAPTDPSLTFFLPSLDSILFTSTHRPRGTEGGKGCPVQAHPRLAFRKTVSKKQ